MSQPKFIIVNKVIDGEGKTVQVKPEMIRLDLVRSVRTWKKTKAQKDSVKGEMIVLYMINDPEDKGTESKDSVVKVAESLDRFSERSQAIKLNPAEIKRLEQDEDTE